MLKTDNTLYKSASTLRGMVKHNTTLGIMYLLSGLLKLLFAVALIYNIYNTWNHTYKNFEELREKEKKSNLIKVVANLVTFIGLLAVSIYFIFLYNPTPDEVTMGILINHLKERGIIQDSVYKILKSYKPSRIGKKVIQ